MGVFLRTVQLLGLSGEEGGEGEVFKKTPSGKPLPETISRETPSGKPKKNPKKNRGPVYQSMENAKAVRLVCHVLHSNVGLSILIGPKNR